MKDKEKLIYGIGTNDANYTTQVFDACYIEGKRVKKRMWMCPFYRRWQNMLERCYSSKCQERNPTYKGCSVCDEWLTFSNFKSWMETQDWEARELDKDVLFPGNKVYGPSMCVFIESSLNSFLTESTAIRGQYMIGVSWHKRDNKFRAQCRDGRGKNKYLGSFNTELEAHQAWLKCKQEMALKLASEQTDPRVAKALIDRYENYVAQEREIA